MEYHTSLVFPWYTQKIKVTHRMFRWYTTQRGYITSILMSLSIQPKFSSNIDLNPVDNFRKSHARFSGKEIHTEQT